MGYPIILEVEISFKRATNEMLELVDRKTHVFVRNRKMKVILTEKPDMKTHSRPTQTRLQSKAH